MREFKVDAPTTRAVYEILSSQYDAILKSKVFPDTKITDKRLHYAAEYFVNVILERMLKEYPNISRDMILFSTVLTAFATGLFLGDSKQDSLIPPWTF
jgi:hypothetical protein